MLRRDPNYRRVRAGGKDIAGRASYWLAGDHLLVVREEGFHERYRRFFHRDVQALVISRTNWGLIFTLIFTALSGLSFLFVVGTESAEGKWIFSGITALCVIGLLANLLAGPTCQCHLRTAVQSERLPGVGRIKRAHRLIAEMTPLIGRAQSDLPQNPVPPPPLPEPVYFAPAPAPTLPPAAPQLDSHYHGRMHAVAFTLMLVDAVLGLFYLLLEHEVIEYLNMAVTLAELGFVVAAIVKQHRTDVPPSIRRILWAVVIFYAVGIVAGIVIGVYIVISSGGRIDIENLSPSQNIALFCFYLVGSGFMLGSGLLGWRFLVLFRRNHLEGSPPPLVGVAPSRGSDVDSAPAPVKSSTPDPDAPASPPSGHDARS